MVHRRKGEPCCLSPTERKGKQTTRVSCYWLLRIKGAVRVLQNKKGSDSNNTGSTRESIESNRTVQSVEGLHQVSQCSTEPHTPADFPPSSQMESETIWRSSLRLSFSDTTLLPGNNSLLDIVFGNDLILQQLSELVLNAWVRLLQTTEPCHSHGCGGTLTCCDPLTNCFLKLFLDLPHGGDELPGQTGLQELDVLGWSGCSPL